MLTKEQFLQGYVHSINIKLINFILNNVFILKLLNIYNIITFTERIIIKIITNTITY